MGTKRCLFCRRRFELYAPQGERQVVCEQSKCRRKLKQARQRKWRRRRTAQWRQARNRSVRQWARAYPRYWRKYRGKHPAYVRRDNSRRVRARRCRRWGVSAKPTP